MTPPTQASTPEQPVIARATLEEHWANATRATQDAGYDALILAGRGVITQYGNVLYFGGFPLFIFHGYVVLMPGEPATLVLNARDGELASTYGVGDLVWTQETAGDDVTYGLVSAGIGLAGPLCDLLLKRGLGSARIGVAGMAETMPVSERDALAELLPAATLEPADALVARVKAVKSQAELERYGEAVAMADAGFALFPDLVKAGADELEIVAAVEYQVRRRGAVHTIIRVLPGLMDPRPPMSRKVIDGELITCYVEMVSPGGFWVEKGACFAVGELPARWQEVYDVSELAFATGEALLTAGTPASDVADAVRRTAESAGCEIGLHIGHGVGIDHDLPLLAEGSDELLQAGMVVAMHPLVQSGDHGAFTIDQYTITDGPPIRHSRFPRQLFHV